MMNKGDCDSGCIEINAELQIEETVSTATETSDTASASASTETTPTNKLARFRLVAYTGAPMRLSGWRFPVIIDLAGLSIPSQKLPIRYSHDSFHGVGHTESVTVENGQLVATGVFSRATPVAQEIIASGRNGFPWQASIGASVEQYEVLRDGQTATVNGLTITGEMVIVRKSKLHEISFVDLGADSHTSAAIEAKGSKTMENEQNMELASALQQSVESALMKQKIMELVETAIATNPHAASKLCDLAITAAKEKWDATKMELEILRATRPTVQPVVKADAVPTNQSILEAGLCLAAGVSDEMLAKDRDYGSAIVEKAWKLRRSGLRSILAMALEANGHRVPHSGEEFFRTLVHAANINASGFSTINLPGLLGNVANKILLAGFQAQPTTYQLIAQQLDVSNFHTHSIYRLDHTGQFRQVPPTGELQHTVLVEDAYSNKLETYGLMLALSRQHVVNDELGAFQQLVFRLGMSARTAIERALYSQVMEATDTFYTTARGNRLTSSALSIATLGQARAALMKMTDAAGDPLNTDGRYLLVPPELEPLANQIFTSQTVTVTTTTDRERAVTNYFVNRYTPVTSAFLSSGSGSGQSPTTWYLVADPQLLPAFQVCFLNGQRTPTIESSDTEFSTLGIQFRAYWDFGVARIDHRGAIKATA